MSRQQQQAIVVPPNSYIHVKDRNNHTYRLEEGPQNFIKLDHEQVVTGNSPKKMISLPSRNYCLIRDPVVRDGERNLVCDKKGQPKIRIGESEVRFAKDYPVPFSLYYGERLAKSATPLTIIDETQSLKVKALRRFTGTDGKKRVPGDVWMVFGPCTYYPRVEEQVVKTLRAQVIKQNQALKLQAVQTFTARDGVKRKAGESWLVRQTGHYLLDVEERLMTLQDAYTITDQRALHLSAVQNFKDVYGVERKAGEEWLVTSNMGESHIIDIHETKVGVAKLYSLNENQYCVILDPVDLKTKLNRLGARELRKGVCQFFLQPGESLEDGAVKQVYILGEDHALLVQARENLTMGETKYVSGDRYCISGPCRYVPMIEEQVVEARERICLDQNEGVYVRDTRTGEVKLIRGQTYMLAAHEELWEKVLSDQQNKLITKLNGHARGDKTRAVTFQVPFNSCVQIYNFKNQKNRVLFGPALAMLQPDENFTLSTLSGKTPKRPGVITTLYIMLGPTFSKDLVKVETSDHARLNLTLSYNWKFDVDRNNQEDSARIFNIRDFIGDMCNLMASKVRAAVAGNTFEEFHQQSARVIRKAIFGEDKDGHINDDFEFKDNGLKIFNVDIKAVEPESKETQRKLKKSVTLAIKITTQSKEANFKHDQQLLDQKNKGQLNNKKIEMDQNAEKLRGDLQKLQAESQNIIQQGTSRAEAEASVDARKIKLEADVESAQLESKSEKIKAEASLDRQQKLTIQRLKHETLLSENEIDLAKQLSEIESNKFQAMMDALERETLVEMAKAGPEQQAELLQGLGLSGFIMTDGNNPINLFNTASGLIGQKPEE